MAAAMASLSPNIGAKRSSMPASTAATSGRHELLVVCRLTVFVVIDLVLSCGVIVVSHVVRGCVITLMSLSILFPFWVASEQKGVQG